MAYRDIIENGHPTLRKVCKPINKITAHTERLLDDMWDTLEKAQGAGLAAPQVNVLRRAVIVWVDGQRYELINPEIIASEGEQIDAEGCLSIPGKAGMVPRPQKVTVRALDRTGEYKTYTGEGFLARAFCHELDHLDGKLYIDIMTEEINLEDQDEAVDDD